MLNNIFQNCIVFKYYMLSIYLCNLYNTILLKLKTFKYVL